MSHYQPPPPGYSSQPPPPPGYPGGGGGGGYSYSTGPSVFVINPPGGPVKLGRNQTDSLEVPHSDVASSGPGLSYFPLCLRYKWALGALRCVLMTQGSWHSNTESRSLRVSEWSRKVLGVHGLSLLSEPGQHRRGQTQRLWGRTAGCSPLLYWVNNNNNINNNNNNNNL